MLSSSPQNGMEAGSEAARVGSSPVASRRNTIQCRQCSEMFPKKTVICPRCTRINDRSYLVLVIKLLIAALFIGIAGWAVWVSNHSENTPPAGEVEKIPRKVHGADGPPDVRF